MDNEYMKKMLTFERNWNDKVQKMNWRRGEDRVTEEKGKLKKKTKILRIDNLGLHKAAIYSINVLDIYIQGHKK